MHDKISGIVLLIFKAQSLKINSISLTKNIFSRYKYIHLANLNKILNEIRNDWILGCVRGNGEYTIAMSSFRHFKESMIQKQLKLRRIQMASHLSTEEQQRVLWKIKKVQDHPRKR